MKSQATPTKSLGMPPDQHKRVSLTTCSGARNSRTGSVLKSRCTTASHRSGTNSGPWAQRNVRCREMRLQSDLGKIQFKRITGPRGTAQTVTPKPCGEIAIQSCSLIHAPRLHELSSRSETARYLLRLELPL